MCFATGGVYLRIGIWRFQRIAREHPHRGRFLDRSVACPLQREGLTIRAEETAEVDLP